MEMNFAIGFAVGSMVFLVLDLVSDYIVEKWWNTETESFNEHVDEALYIVNEDH